MDPQKVVIVSHYYPPHIGGIEIVVQHQAQGLAAAGYDVSVVSCAARNTRPGTISEGRVSVYLGAALNFFDDHFNIPFPIPGVGIIKQLFSEIRVADTVQLHDVFYLPVWIAYVFARAFKKNIVLTQHVAMVEHSNRAVMLFQRMAYATWGKMIFNGCNRIIVYNINVKNFLIGKGVPAAKIAELRNGIDLSKFYPADAAEKEEARRRFKLPAKKTLVLFVGRLVPKKGFDALLDAADPDYDIVFAGPGEVKDEWRSRSGTHFMGPLGQNELANLYRAADLFVFPAHGEIFTLAMQEAMASRLPVVTADEPGYANYEVDRDLMIFSKPVAAVLKQNIRRVVSDSRLRGEMGRYSATLAKKWFSRDANMENMIAIYRNLGQKKADIIVTTSWDDGHILDLCLADLLRKYNLKGTFYVAPENCELASENKLSRGQIKELSNDFEIGAHTMNHGRLPKLSDAQARTEIEQSKKFLEEIIGKTITSFCYPGGEYRTKHARMAREAGFTYARTVKRHAISAGELLEAKTSVHTYNHLQDIFKIARFANFNPVKTVKYFQWDELAKAMFDRVRVTGGEFHLWGHSWEVDGHNDWEKLESVFAHISGKPDVSYLTNRELAQRDKKNILVAAPYFPPQAGGVPFYAYNTAKRLKDDYGRNVAVAASGKRGFFGIEIEQFEGLKVYRLPYWFKISNTPVNPLWPLMLARIIKKERISIINAHAPVPGFGDCVALAADKKTFILTYHTGSLRKGAFLFDLIIWMYENFALKLLMKRADSIICASDYVRLNFLKEYSSKSATIAPAVDCGNFKPDPAKKPVHPTILFVAGIARAEKYKGLTTLIDAVALIGKTISELRLVVVGGGDMKDEYENYAKTIGLQDRIMFKGKLIGGDLVDAYQRAHIFVLPTSYDNAPMVIVEAMACGLPVVSTKIGEIPLIVDHGKTGFLIDPGKPEVLAAKISELFKNSKMMADFGNAARLKCENKFDWPDRIASYNQILEKSAGLESKK